MVTLATLASEEPPASSTDFRFSQTWRVSALIPPSMRRPVFGSIPSWPDAKTQSPILIACESGTRAGGTVSVCTTVRFIDDPSMKRPYASVWWSRSTRRGYVTCRGDAASGARRDFDERIVEAAATAPVGRFFPRERVDRCERATRVHDAAKRHPGHTWSHALGHAAHGAHFARAVPDSYRLSRTDGARGRIVLVQLDEELTGASAMRVHMPVSRIEKVQGLAGDELETRSDRDSSIGRQRIQAAFEQRLRVELGLAAGGRKRTFGKWAPVRRRLQPHPPLAPQALVRNPLEPGMATRKCRPQHRFVALEEPRLRSIERRRQATKELSVRDGLTAWSDRRPV